MIKNITLVIIVLIIFQVKAQPSTEFLNKYYKLNLEISTGYFHGAKTSELPSTLSYSFKNYVAPRFGLHYDFLRKGNFNFKVGFSAFLLREIEEISINKSEIPLNVNYPNFDYAKKTETFSADWQFNIPITVEYIMYYKKSKIAINASYIIGYQNYYYAETDFSVGGNGSGEVSGGATVFKGVHSRGNNAFHPGAQIGVGMYFPFKRWMLRTNLYYNIMLEKMFEGKYEWKNFTTHPDINGTYSFSGNSFGVEFSIYLAKKKKKNK